MKNPVPEERRVESIVTAHRQQEGAGFVVRRALPTGGLELAGPFLLIDEMGPVDYAPGAAQGAPDHPHRGFETVTYILEGSFMHEDSAGHRGVLQPGDVQWMTAGAGIVHSEMPSEAIRKNGGRVHGFQIWVNLPARLKLTTPRYQGVSAARLPVAESPDGLAHVRVIAGEALGASAVIDTHTPIVFQDWTLAAGANVELPIPREQQALVYVFGGSARIGAQHAALVEGQLAVLGQGDTLRLRAAPDANVPARLLVLAGVSIDEPVARYGPFVMNTRSELEQAVRDYQSGKMGEITRSARGA